jgi:hypothetical protein
MSGQCLLQMLRCNSRTAFSMANKVLSIRMDLNHAWTTMEIQQGIAFYLSVYRTNTS